jgi:hypothetical protein
MIGTADHTDSVKFNQMKKLGLNDIVCTLKNAYDICASGLISEANRKNRPIIPVISFGCIF